MTIAKEVVYALHKRLKDLSVNAAPDQLAYLAKALESIAGQSTVLDIVQMTDEKLKEILDNTTNHLRSLDSSKTNALTAISELEKQSLKKIDDKGTSNLSLVDTRKNTTIAAIDSKAEEHLQALTKVQRHIMVDSKSLPFLFGVLSRFNNYLSYGNFTSELGKWYSDTSKTDNMLQLLTGSHNYNTSYVAFYRPPQLYFLQGKNGTFIYNELYLRYAYSSNQYQYPYALLGVIFVKNKTNSNITRTLNFAATSHWSSGYEGVGLFVGIPNHTDNEKSEISEIKWSNIYNYSSSNNYFTASGSIQIPANKTVSIILYTTPYQHYNNYNYYSQYMQWGIYNFRSNFLTDGLEVDIERTLKAWQCPGSANTFEIWR